MPVHAAGIRTGNDRAAAWTAHEKNFWG